MSRHVMVIAILIATDYVNPTRGQVSATTLVVELENVVEYQVDTSDLSKWGTKSQNHSRAASLWGWRH